MSVVVNGVVVVAVGYASYTEVLVVVVTVIVFAVVVRRCAVGRRALLGFVWPTDAPFSDVSAAVFALGRGGGAHREKVVVSRRAGPRSSWRECQRSDAGCGVISRLLGNRGAGVSSLHEEDPSFASSTWASATPPPVLAGRGGARERGTERGE